MTPVEPPAHRRFLGLLALLAASPLRALAQGADGLLKPGSVGTTAHSDAARIDLDSSRQASLGLLKSVSPADGRAVAAATVVEVDGLAEAAARLVREMEALQRLLKQHNQELADLIQQMEAKLEEYRQGLFCSGCGKTRSEILARGETFPHSGQSIIRATSQQIAQKEREGQELIDSKQRQIASEERRLLDLRARRDEALEQIALGVDYWQTGYSYELHALNLQLSALGQDYRARREKIDKVSTEIGKRIFQLRTEIARDPGAAPQALREQLADHEQQLKFWHTSIEQLDRARMAQEAQFQQRQNAARARYQQEAERLAQAVSRAPLVPILSLPITTPFKATSSAADNLGIRYRRGDYDPKNSQTTVAPVSRFIEQFRGLAFASVRPGQNAVSGPLLAPNISAAPAPAQGADKVPSRLLELR